MVHRSIRPAPLASRTYLVLVPAVRNYATNNSNTVTVTEAFILRPPPTKRPTAHHRADRVSSFPGVRTQQQMSQPTARYSVLVSQRTTLRDACVAATRTSSRKPEVHNILKRRHKRTEPRPQAICVENSVKFGRLVPEISMRSHTDRQTGRKTVTLVTILRSSTGGGWSCNYMR